MKKGSFSMVDSAVLDLSELLDRIGGDEEFALELLQEFRSQLDNEITALKEILDGRDSRSLHHKSHSLKGSALNLSAKSLADVAKVMEHAGKSGDFDAARGCYPTLLAETDRLKQEIDRLF